MPAELFTATVGSSSRGSVSTGIRDADIESISRSGELLLVMDRKRIAAGVQPGTLARAPSGGAPRPIVEDVQHADWSRDGSKAAIAHYVNQHFRLEYPIGNTLYETPTGWISSVRVSPSGDMVAFLDHPLFGDDAGSVAIVDLNGHKRNLGPTWASLRGLQWGSRDEIWFSANETGIALTLYGVNTSGKLRTILRVPSGLKLLDVGKDGRVLIAQGQRRRQVLFSGPGDKTERDLAVADWCIPVTISDDGKTVLLDEEAENTETGNYTVYLRKTDGSAPVRLGEGLSRAMSRDGKWALVMTQQPPQQLVLLPTGAGEPRQITNDSIAHRSACFLDDTHIAFSGVEPGHQPRTYVQATDQNTPRPITPEGVSGNVTCSPDGRAVLVMSDKAWYAPVASGTPSPIPGTEAIFSQNTSWTSDPGFVYMVDTRALPIRIYRVDVTTGARKEVKAIMPVDPAGAEAFEPVRVTPDLKSYVYNIPRNLNELYLVESLK